MGKLAISVDKHQEIIDLYLNNNLTTYQIADIFHVCCGVINRILKINNIKLKSKSSYFINELDKYKDDILDLYLNKGNSSAEIAKIYSVGRGKMEKFLHKQGIEKLKHVSEYRAMFKDEELTKSVIEMYLNQIPVNIIAEKNNCSTTVIRKILRRNNLEIRQISYYSDIKVADELEIIDMYVNKKISMAKIGKILRVDSKKIPKILKRNDIPNNPTERKKKYNIDENYFEKIDSPDKAYFLGFLLADGNVSDENKKKYCIRLGIQVGDIDILQKFQKCLKSNIPIQIVKRKNKNDECLFRINNKKMWNDLQKWEMKPRKSLTLKFPDIDKRYLYSFMRGYIDGDGSIKVYKNFKEFHLSFISTIEFIESAIKLLDKTYIRFGILKPTKYKNTDKNIYTAKSGHKTNIILFLNKIYENEGDWLHLDRKYKTYLEMKDFLEKNPVNLKMIHNSP